ncbi:MAG: hypothetical protein C5B56_10390, partial [Proteobacteria bacterium]
MNSDLTWRAANRTRELEESNRALRRSQEMLAQELDAARRLHQIATELISARGAEELYTLILDTARAILHADFACIQRFCPDRGSSGELHLIGHRGI